MKLLLELFAPVEQIWDFFTSHLKEILVVVAVVVVVLWFINNFASGFAPLFKPSQSANVQ